MHFAMNNRCGPQHNTHTSHTYTPSFHRSIVLFDAPTISMRTARNTVKPAYRRFRSPEDGKIILKTLFECLPRGWVRALTLPTRHRFSVILIRCFLFFFCFLSCSLFLSQFVSYSFGGGMRLKRFFALLLAAGWLMKDEVGEFVRLHIMQITNYETHSKFDGNKYFIRFLCFVCGGTRWFVCNFSVTYVVHGDDVATSLLSCASHSV